ncbi:macrolide export ATP-binding/permease protein MacB [Thioalkalivibrio nitratireducens DSM 14787]|uniref:Macrolide export ATP-binding/permease protein MacB n=1 Tax=Thioalkalivibrio nitratireducens (strain DSM 14787 / UNIQEM 213 / ALEN2) TaxID=1255043 RepID=L0DW85_THIND|nr:ABC transporter permease [Thioalkalivibrio nitratireducens]AGA33288.1 macrolide export ATP-binding/permease protein MacB [Thioalkalivibrio nitratireducens DSM 14787]
MIRVLRLSARNLARYWRRSLLTSGLIVLGMVAVLLFVAVSASFKQIMIGQITDSMLGHLQVHQRGYVASIENLPLNLNMKPEMVARVEALLREMPEVEAITPRLKFGAMLSDFEETTNIRLNGVEPEREAAAMPLLAGRLLDGEIRNGLLAPGALLLPELLARGMGVQVGDTVVLVATNVDGSVNGRTFLVQGVLDAVTGPGGRDGYLHIDDARALLRMDAPEVNQIAVRLQDPGQTERVARRLEQRLGEIVNPRGQPLLTVHTWDQLTPFANIARMIDLLDLFIRIMLVGIVLIAVMNVMIMSVYERVREIGTIAAIGTPPGRILLLFVGEGVLLAVAGTVVGTLISLGVVRLLNVWPLEFAFGRQEIVLAPALALGDILWVAAIVVAVAAAASLQPAWKAARMDPNTALRHV